MKESWLRSKQFQIDVFSIFVAKNYIIRRCIYEYILNFATLAQGSLLDFGCGSKPYKKYFTNVDKYVGLEYDNGDLSKSHSADIVYSGNVLPFNNEHFDSVLATEVIEHIFNLDAMLDEIYRVIKPGGYFFITIPFIFGEHEVPNDYGRYTRYGIRKILEDHNFEVIEIQCGPNAVLTSLQVFIEALSRNNFPSKFAKYLRFSVLIPLAIVSNIFAFMFWNAKFGNKGMYLSTGIIAQKQSE